MSSRNPQTPWLPGPSGGKVGSKQGCEAMTGKAPGRLKDTKPEKRNPNDDGSQFAPSEAKMIPNHKRMGGYG